MDKKSTTSQRLQQIMQIRNMKQIDILAAALPYCKKYGIKLNKSDLSQFVNGKVEPGQWKLSILGMALDVSEAWLMGLDVPIERERREKTKAATPDGFLPPPHTVKKPRLGCIVCGDPIDSPENLDGYDDVPENIHCDFTLRCEGDSMTDARINDGDIVYIRQQEQVDNGTIAAVSIDGEKTLKRVYWDGKTLILQPANPKYQPYVYSGEILNTVRIIGKAVGFTSVIK